MSAQAGRASVLIVEDEGIVAHDLQHTLADLGYETLPVVSSGEAAIAYAGEKCPDIVLMDIQIKGGLDGIQTAEILKKRFDVPVVYLTAHADEATLARAKVTEPHGYLLKPVKAGELRSFIEVALFKHRMEKELRERERWFATTLRSIRDAVITVDTSGKVIYLNASAEALIGLPASKCLGQSDRDILRLLDQSFLETGETPLERVLRLGQPVERHRTILVNHSTGAKRLIEDVSALVVDQQLVLGAVMVLRDVTERAKMEERLEFAERLSSLGTMAAGAAHELNSPLAVVIGNADFVAEELKRIRADVTTPASVQEREKRFVEALAALADLRSASRRIARVVTDLRAFSKPGLEANNVVDPARCVEWAVRATEYEFQDRATVLIRPGDVPRVRANENKLEQVIINLLINAAQAVPPGARDQNDVTVATSTDELGRAVIEIRDTGTGIPADVLPRIFYPFFTTRPAGAGTGLGLSICHGIVSSLGGEITVESTVGNGATFRVVLPPASPETAPPKPPSVERESSGPAAAFAPPGVPLRAKILVIDDKKTLLQIMRRTLQKHQHEVLCIESARQGAALIEHGRMFDVVFCDLMMPDMTGIQFYESLLKINSELARRVVFMTGGATTAKADAFLRTIPNMIVEKPFEPIALLEMVQRLLVNR